jgi:hypothetical protein
LRTLSKSNKKYKNNIPKSETNKKKDFIDTIQPKPITTNAIINLETISTNSQHKPYPQAILTSHTHKPHTHSSKTSSAKAIPTSHTYKPYPQATPTPAPKHEDQRTKRVQK